jgi:hypothetical protein
LLLLADGVRFQFLHFTMFFKELVEQHRVHSLVADRRELPLNYLYEAKR